MSTEGRSRAGTALPSEADLERMSPQALLAVGTALVDRAVTGSAGTGDPSLPTGSIARERDAELDMADRMLAPLDGTAHAEAALEARLRICFERGDLDGARSLVGTAPASELMERVVDSTSVGTLRSMVEQALAMSLPGVEGMLVNSSMHNGLVFAGWPDTRERTALAAYLRSRGADEGLPPVLRQRLREADDYDSVTDLGALTAALATESTELATMLRDPALDETHDAARVARAACKHVQAVRRWFGYEEAPVQLDVAERCVAMLRSPAVLAALGAAPRHHREECDAELGKLVGAVVSCAERVVKISSQNAKVVQEDPDRRWLTGAMSEEDAWGHLKRVLDAIEGWADEASPRATGAIERALDRWTEIEPESRDERVAIEASVWDLGEEVTDPERRARNHVAAIKRATADGATDAELMELLATAETEAERQRLDGDPLPSVYLAWALEGAAARRGAFTLPGFLVGSRSKELLEHFRDVQDRLWARVAQRGGPEDDLLRALEGRGEGARAEILRTPRDIRLVGSEAAARAALARAQSHLRPVVDLLEMVDRSVADGAALGVADEMMGADPGASVALLLEYLEFVTARISAGHDQSSTDDLWAAVAERSATACRALDAAGEIGDLVWVRDELESEAAHAVLKATAWAPRAVELVRLAREVGVRRAEHLVPLVGSSVEIRRHYAAQTMDLAFDIIDREPPSTEQRECRARLVELMARGDAEELVALCSVVAREPAIGELAPERLSKVGDDLWLLGLGVLGGERDVESAATGPFERLAVGTVGAQQAATVVESTAALIRSIDARSTSLPGPVRGVQATALVLQGWAHQRLGDERAADAAFRRAVDVAPFDAPPSGAYALEVERAAAPIALWANVLASRGSLAAEVLPLPTNLRLVRRSGGPLRAATRRPARDRRDRRRRLGRAGRTGCSAWSAGTTGWCQGRRSRPSPRWWGGKELRVPVVG